MKVHALCNKFEVAQSAVGTILKDMAKYSKEVNNTRTMQTILIHTRGGKTVMWINGRRQQLHIPLSETLKSIEAKSLSEAFESKDGDTSNDKIFVAS